MKTRESIFTSALDKFFIGLAYIFSIVKRHFLKWKDYAAMPAGLILFYYQERIVRWKFPLEVSPGAAILYDIINVIVVCLVLYGFHYILFMMNEGKDEKFIDTDYDKAFDDLTGWQKIKISALKQGMHLLFVAIIALAVFLSGGYSLSWLGKMYE